MQKNISERIRRTNANRGVNMTSRIIIAAAFALFFPPAARVLSQEHPEHPSKGTAAKKGGAEKRVSTADISTGIKANIDGETKKSSDGKFHVQYEGQDLAMDLVNVHDDSVQDLAGGKQFALLETK